MNKRITELDGLRAIAVILVFLNHYAPVASLPWLHPIRRVGWIGVDIFFVLSGFLITGILMDTRGNKTGYYKSFYMRRSLRIFPLYYGLLTAVLMVMSVWKWHHLREMIANWGNPAWFYAYLGNVKTAVSNVSPPSQFVPMWSLHVEEQFYLIFPFLVRRLRMRQLTQVLIGAVIAAPIIRLGLYWLFPASPLLQYMLLPCRIDALALGALVAIRRPTRESPLLPGRNASSILAALGVLWLACQIFWQAGGAFDTPVERTIGYSLFDISFAGCLILILTFRGSRGTAWLNWKPLQYTGMISYGLYLLQAPAASLVDNVFRKTTGHHVETNTLLGSFSIAVTCVGLATVSWYLWEAKWLSMKSRFVSRPEPRVPSPAPSHNLDSGIMVSVPVANFTPPAVS